jgi:hypothetical protein
MTFYQKFFVSFLAGLLLFGCAHLPEAPPEARPAKQILFIALDGVPYSVMKELKEEGHFAAFQIPSKVISTFPSTTTAAFGGMFRPLGAKKPLGYDRKFFSNEEKEIQGFILGGHDKRLSDHWRFFDYHRKTPFQKTLIYLVPGFSGRRDLEKTRKLIWSRPDRQNYLVYIGGTDGSGHVLGRRRLKRWLIFMDRTLEKLRRDYERRFGRRLEIVLFADHGFHFRKPRGVPKASLAYRLRKAGLNFSNNLKKDHRVVSIEWGNISGANFHLHKKHVPKVAEILVGLEGIDLVTYREGPKIILLSSKKSREKAEIHFEERSGKFKYLPLEGDPLNYRPIAESLRRKGKVDRQGFASAQDWLEETRDHYYPDALYRIRDAFFSLVENPASILVSTKEDYEYGDFRTRVGSWFRGRLKGTHGGLFQESSAAFVMTTDRQIKLPPAMRYDQVMKYFNSSVSPTAPSPRRPRGGSSSLGGRSPLPSGG